MTLLAPYPSDTRAKGWRFELDYEQIEQSDTWSLASEIPMAPHALVMMWLVSWTQVPCGSFPNDEDIIRAKCKIPTKVWPQVRQILMRGWWEADDGRLYHDTIVKRVLEMLEYRRKEAERRNRNRGKTPVVPRDTDGTEDGETPAAPVTPGTGTGTSPSLRSGVGAACRGTRLPPDWAPDAGLVAWASAERPDLNIPKTVESFRDFWNGKPGKDGVKLDWPATFRNWVRKERPSTPATPAQPQARPAVSVSETQRYLSEQASRPAVPPPDNIRQILNRRKTQHEEQA